MQTPLDEALAAAAESEDHQPAYYDLLLRTDLYVQTLEVPSEEGERRAGEDESVQLVISESEGRRLLVLFDTRERLEAWGEAEIGFVRLPGHALLRAVDPGIEWLVNPGTGFAKHLVPEELDWLRGQLSADRVEPLQKDRGTKVTFSPPSQEPEDLRAALTAVFERNPEVRQAHLVEVAYGDEPAPRLGLVATLVEGTTALAAIQEEIGVACRGFLEAGGPLDMFLDQEEASQAAREVVPPFYVREVERLAVWRPAVEPAPADEPSEPPGPEPGRQLSKAEKKRLKKLGKKEVEARSALLDSVLEEANPAPLGSDEWMASHRRGIEREKQLRCEPPRVITAREAEERFALRFVSDDFSAGYPRSDELHYHCHRCGDLVPAAPERSLGCGCGNLAIDVVRGRLVEREAGSVALVGLVGKG